jgi:hypothetical protein
MVFTIRFILNIFFYSLKKAEIQFQFKLLTNYNYHATHSSLKIWKLISHTGGETQTEGDNNNSQNIIQERLHDLIEKKFTMKNFMIQLQQ